MAKKEYTLKINGVSESVKDVTALETAIQSLDATVKNVSKETVAAATASKTRKVALSEEEKAEQKLVNTIDKVVQARTDANKAQIEANIAAREAQREVTREIQIRQQAEGSIKQMGMQLTDLRNQYDGLSKAQREDITVGGELLEQIRSLDAEYKILKESTGRFQDSVGNYGKALDGLDQLQQGLDGVSKTSMGLAQGLIASNQIIELFGNQSEESAEKTKRLQSVIAVLSIAQQVNTNILKEGVKAGNLFANSTLVQTTRLKAKAAAEAAATKNTVTATVAQKAFNLVAKANPYVLLALALVGVGAALTTYAKKTKEATTEQKNLNAVNQKAVDNYAEQITELTRMTKQIQASTTSNKQKQKILKQVNEQYLDQNNQLKNINELEDFLINKSSAVIEVWTLRAKAAAAYDLAVETNKEALKKQQKSESEYYTGFNKFLGKLFLSQDQYSESVRNKRESDETEAKKNVNNLLDLYQQYSDEYLKKAKELGLKTEEHAKGSSVPVSNTKEIADNLRRNLELTRKAQDDETTLISNSFERRRKETQLKYERQTADLREQLKKDKSLNEEGKKAINSIISNLEKHRTNDLNKIREDELAAEKAQSDKLIEEQKKRSAEILKAQEQRGALELERLNDFEKNVKEIQDNAVNRQTGGLQLIDVGATRKNLDEASRSIGEYVSKLEAYKETEKRIHEDRIKTLEQNTPEYEAEMQKYARSVEDITRRIKQAQSEQVQNTKRAAQLQFEYYRDMFAKISEYADMAAWAIYSSFDTVSYGLQIQLEDLNAQLETVSERYEDAKKLREEAVESVEELEKQLQSATGGTAAALREQLQDSMHARAEAEREEKRLLKEKEKREAEIQKKEKQQKRADLISDIAVGLANTAKAVVQALSFGPPPVGIAFSILMGTLGAIQTGIMAKQLSKLEKGGEIIGPSHANGGVPIPGTNYEAEGGEFVVNKRSYAANESLINFINDTPRIITAADLLGVVPGNTAPIVVADVGQASEDRIVEAINGINFRPVVSVTDINDVSNEVVTVRDLAGF